MKTSAPSTRRGVCHVRSFFMSGLLFLVAAATSGAQGTAIRVENFSLKPDGAVVVENPRGATRIESWDDQTVRVVAEKKALPGSSIEPGELVLMGAQNSIIVQCKQGAGRIDLTLYVPSSAQLQVTGGAWPVDVSGSFAGSVIDTTSGHIGYRLPVSDDAHVVMRSAMGTVRSTLTLTAVERAGMRSLQGRIGTGTVQIILNSQNGNVTLSPAAAVARASNKKVYATNTQTSQDVTSAQSGVQQNNRGSQAINVDPVQQEDPRSAASTNQVVQNNGSVDFAGSDRSGDSNSTVTNGPLTRPRRARTTNSDSSGLKARIIPSNPSPRTSRDAAGSVFDQPGDQDDPQNSGQPSASGARSPGAAGSNSGASGSVVFAGSDRAGDSKNNTRGGPFERDRQARSTSGGDSGLRVRIIPAPTMSSSAGSGSVFDSRDEYTNPARTSRTTSQAGVDDRIENDVQRSSNGSRAAARTDVNAGQDEIAEANSRAGSPPSLRRSTSADSPDSSANGGAEKTTRASDEDAIVLKAALVNLNVSVTNRSGVALADLKKEDFDVAENGERQNIEFFQPTSAPFNLILALDLSGSIKDKLDVVKSAALRFLEVVGPQDKVAVVTFTDEIRVVSQLTGDREELKRRIKMIDRSQGGTAFYEAVWFSLVDTLRGTRGQRNAIVVMTDGVDSSLDRYNPMESRVSFVQLARRLEESDVIVFPIYLDTEYEEVFDRGNSTSEAYAIARDQLERIAEVSGGQMFKAEKANDLSGVYKQVAAAIRTVYSVGYYPTNSERDGTFRRVRIVVNRPDAAVRTRKGYYAR